MSLTNTIAQGSAPSARGFSVKGLGMVIAALIVGAAIGSAIVNRPTTNPVVKVAATSLALDDFIRLNTTSYTGLVPTPSSAVVQPAPATDPFLEMNVSSYEGLASTMPRGVGGSGNVVDPRFIYWNTGAFDGLAREASTPTVAAGLYELNTTSLEYRTRGNTSQPFGPR